MLPRLLILLCLAVASLPAQTTPKVPTEPPVFNQSFQGASFSVDVDGTWPTTYQWYRVNAKGDVPVPAPLGIQSTLILKQGDTAGVYYCIATNAAGPSTSGTFRLSFTAQDSAADLQVVIKKP
jgi:hypothetical protein